MSHTPSPSRLNLMRRMSYVLWYRADELTTVDYAHPISVDNALRSLAKAGLVETRYLTSQTRGHRLTDAGFAALNPSTP